MCKILFPALFIFIATFSYAQITLTIEDIDTTVTGSDGYNVPRNTPTTLTIQRSRFVSGEKSAYIVQAGDDSYVSIRDNNLDGAKIIGNKFVWTGYNTYPTSTMHGLMVGYNINYIIKHNFFDHLRYTSVFKGGIEEPMTWTAGAHSYNIHYNTKALTIKGIAGIRVYNNTFYSTGFSPLYHISIEENTGGEPDHPATNTQIKNNIFYQKDVFPAIRIRQSSCLQGLVCDYNVYYVESGSNNEPTFSIDGRTVSWSEWKALGYDAHSVVINPNFVDEIHFAPSARLDYGQNLGSAYNEGLTTDATWIVGKYPKTALQDATWQVGAVLLSSASTSEPETPTVSETPEPASDEPKIYHADYYVSPDGSDSNPGTFDKPWASWDKAFETATSPGDTTYFRGGVYYATTKQDETDGINGTAEAPVCFFNYPGEKPILDCSPKTKSSPGVQFYKANHIKVRGLTVRNNRQIGGATNAYGFYFYLCPHVTVDKCVTHDIGYRGFYFFDVDTLYVNKCDSYNVVDSLSTAPGNAGDGYIMSGRDESDTTDYAVFKQCRAWHVSDDGWDIHSNGYIELDSCWAFNCGGYEAYNWGNGLKMDLSVWLPRTMLSRRVTNCVLAYNRGSGLTTNDNNTFPMPMEIIGNTSVYNGLYGSDGHGFTVLNSGGTDAQEKRRVFKYNIAFGNTVRDFNPVPGAGYSASLNSWQDAVTDLASHFVSVDSTGLSAPRKADGSLPDLPFFIKKRTASHLIDAPIEAGYDLLYYGNGPDLGHYEYEPLRITSYSPNPTINNVSVEYFSPEENAINISVKNSSGAQVLSINQNSTFGNNKANINLSALPADIYNILLSNGVESDVCEVIKQGSVSQEQLKIVKSFPNPTFDLFAIKYTSPNEIFITVKVIDESATTVLEAEYLAFKGVVNKIVLNLSSLPTGNYNIELSDGASIINTKVTKQ
jgi:hypothetical protein